MADTDIRTYDGLVSAIGNWLDGPNDRLANAIPNMIALAEADFRRQLVVPDMEVQFTIDPSQGSIPDDVDSIRSLVVLGDRQMPLSQLSPTDFYALGSTQTGQPRYYALINETLLTWPTADTTYSALLSYRQSIPGLSTDNPTNWLLTLHPDAYLFGSLLQAEFFGWNDDRLPIIQAKLQATIDDINRAGNRKRYGGPLVMRPAVDEALRATCG